MRYFWRKSAIVLLSFMFGVMLYQIWASPDLVSSIWSGLLRKLERPPSGYSPPVTLSSPNQQAVLPQLIAAPGGGHYAAWLTMGGGGARIVLRYRSGGGWGAPEVVPMPPDHLPIAYTIGVDASHVLHLAYVNKNGESRRVVYLRKVGDPWTAAQDISVGKNPAHRPQLVLDHAGDVHMAWYVAQGHNAAVVYRKKEKGVWLDGEFVSPREKFASFWRPHLAIDVHGAPHLVYFRIDPKGSSIQHTHRWAAHHWSEATRISLPGKRANNPKLIFDEKGEAHVIWVDREDGIETLAYAIGNGTSWSQQMRISRDGFNVEDHQIARGASGRLLVTWVELSESGHETVYFRRGRGEQWLPEQRISWEPGRSITPWILPQNQGADFIWTNIRPQSDPGVFWSSITLLGE